MIVASLLLILVAVTLLVLGLTGGSSTLLIASIAASLLAAIALVVGARAARRAAEARGEPALDAESDFSTSGRSSARPSDYAAEPIPDEYDYATPAGATPPGPAAASGYAEPPFGHAGTPRVNDPGSMMDDPSAPEEGLASAGSMHARGASREDAESALRADAAYQETYGAPGPDLDDPDLDDLEYEEPESPESGYNDAVLTDEDAYERERAARAGGEDYDQASSFIGGARSETPGSDAWRRAATGTPEAARDAAAAGAGIDGPSSEFAEPDADDPDDEPLPQAVKPADAVRIAQLDDDVLVVDGRPRYHMADCAFLAGKLTDELPVSEAVELGFSPCGLCRPVDRLVAQAAHR